MNVKPGYATSELWTQLITQGLALFAILHPGFNAQQWQPLASAVAVVAAAVASGVYALGRSQVKVAAAAAPAAPASIVVGQPSSTTNPVAVTLVASGDAAPQDTVPAVAPPAADPVAAGAAPPPAPQAPTAADTAAAPATPAEVPPAATTDTPVTMPPA